MSESHPPVIDRRRVVVYLLVAAGIGCAAVWYFGLRSDPRASPTSNSIMVILPYRYGGTWVFDDESVGLVREPFVAGVPEMIDVLVADVPNAEEGFRLSFPGIKKN